MTMIKSERKYKLMASHLTKVKEDENTDLYITGVSQQRMKMYLLILVFSFQQESTLISCIQLVI